jgi:uncharacterized protein YneF (UPF0154 family)
MDRVRGSRMWFVVFVVSGLLLLAQIAFGWYIAYRHMVYATGG